MSPVLPCASPLGPDSLYKAPWAHDCFPWWFDKTVFYEYQFRVEWDEISLREHSKFFWTSVARAFVDASANV